MSLNLTVMLSDGLQGAEAWLWSCSHCSHCTVPKICQAV